GLHCVFVKSTASGSDRSVGPIGPTECVGPMGAWGGVGGTDRASLARSARPPYPALWRHRSHHASAMSNSGAPVRPRLRGGNGDDEADDENRSILGNHDSGTNEFRDWRRDGSGGWT